MAIKSFIGNEEITISELSGKLEGFYAFSSSVLKNIFCQSRKNIKGSVCMECYAEAIVNRWNVVGKSTENNFNVITKRLYEITEFPYIPFSVFRLEALADVSSVIHARNYIRFAKRNPHCIFTGWTKNYNFWDIAFSLEDGKPENMIMGISSLYLNKSDIEIAKKYSWCNFCFTVFTADFAKENNIEMNCPRKCISCMKCYSLETFNNRTEPLEINEILKSDSKKISVEGD